MERNKGTAVLVWFILSENRIFIRYFTSRYLEPLNSTAYGDTDKRPSFSPT